MIHSFWAYQLGVKADANPGVDNIAYVTTKGPLTFNVHCAELCGVWHGYMFDTGKVVAPAQVRDLDRSAEQHLRAGHQAAAAYSKRYFPDPRGEVDDRDHAPRRPTTPLWRRLVGFNLLTGIVLAVVGGVIGQLIGNAIHAPSIDYFATEAGQNDIAVLLGYFFGVIGFLIGLGFANYPVRRMLGHPPTLAEHEGEGEGMAALLPPLHRPQGRRASSTSSGSGCSSSSAASTRC